MLVKNWMNTEIVSVKAEDSVQEALDLLSESDLHILPVMQEGKLLGLVSATDLKKAPPSDLIKEIMIINPVVVPPDFTIEETAALLMQKNILGVPVQDAWGRVVGTITRDDLFRAFISLTGLGQKGLQIAFQVEDQPGIIKKLSDTIRTFGGRIANIISSVDRVPPGSKLVYIRAYDIDRATLPQMLAELQALAKILYLVDHRDNTRTIYSETISSYSV